MYRRRRFEHAKNQSLFASIDTTYLMKDDKDRRDLLRYVNIYACLNGDRILLLLDYVYQ